MHKLSTKVLVCGIAMISGMVLPATAQESRQLPQSYWQNTAPPTSEDNLRVVATNLNAQRSEAFRKKDLAAIGALYTPDATYVELLPRIDVMQGRAQIEAHFKDLMAANATDIIPTITSVEMMGDGAMLAGGDYTLNLKEGKKIFGHFFQILRQQGGTWKIAMHAFARPQPVTPVEASEYNRAGGG
jgi:uncharacterized protein (TIGR02246 family)